MDAFKIVEGGMQNLADGTFVAGGGPAAKHVYYGHYDEQVRAGYTSNWDGFEQAMRDASGNAGPVSAFIHGYSGSELPATFAASSVASAPTKGIGAMLNTKRPWQELADGDYDATITSLFNSWPVDTFGSVTINHEPENDGPTPANPSNPSYVTWANANAPIWKAGINRFIDVAAPIIRSRGLDVKVGGCLMDFSWDTTRWQFWNWWDDITPANLNEVAFQIDAYSKTVNGTPPVGYSLEPRINELITEMRSVGIQHFELWETANDRRERNNGDVLVGTDESVATWWENYIPFLESIPEVRMCGYFSIPTGPASGKAALMGRGIEVYAEAALNGARP